MVVDLAVAFIETFGEWAAKERDAKIGKCFPKATTEDVEQVEYDETEIEGLNATMAGIEFIDEGVKWRVYNIEFDAEHEELLQHQRQPLGVLVRARAVRRRHALR